MPVYSPAGKLVCPKCGWRKLVPPQSDVRLPNQHIDKCPKCGNCEIQFYRLNMLENFLFKISRKF